MAKFAEALSRSRSPGDYDVPRQLQTCVWSVQRLEGISAAGERRGWSASGRCALRNKETQPSIGTRQLSVLRKINLAPGFWETRVVVLVLLPAVLGHWIQDLGQERHGRRDVRALTLQLRPRCLARQGRHFSGSSARLSPGPPTPTTKSPPSRLLSGGSPYKNIQISARRPL